MTSQHPHDKLFWETYRALEHNPLAISEHTEIIWSVQIGDMAEAGNSALVDALYSVDKNAAGDFTLMLVATNTSANTEAPFFLEPILTDEYPVAPVAVLSDTQIQNMLNREATVFGVNDLAYEIVGAGYTPPSVNPDALQQRASGPTM